jgi:hypothetical protein
MMRDSATTATSLPDDMAQVTIGVGLTNCAADPASLIPLIATHRMMKKI